MNVVIVLVRGAPVAQNVRVAGSFVERFMGLLGRSSLSIDDGMIFRPGGGIHTIGMRCAIDVAFLDAEDRVLRVCHQVKPLRFCMAPRGTCSTLELASGALAIGGIEVGERLTFTHAVENQL